MRDLQVNSVVPLKSAHDMGDGRTQSLYHNRAQHSTAQIVVQTATSSGRLKGCSMATTTLPLTMCSVLPGTGRDAAPR